MGNKRITFTLEQIEEAHDNMQGFCIACGALHEGLEPDAREDPCEECGENKVYGAEELAVMGLVAG